MAEPVTADAVSGVESTPRTVVLLAGASGSGKSRVARLAGCPHLALDDFYRDLDHPGLPRTPSTASGRRLGIVDWDDVLTWDGDAALAVISQLCWTGRAQVPRYDIATSRRTGSYAVVLGSARCFVAEGLFAAELVSRCRSAGLPVEPLYLHRPRTLTLVLRFIRDLREHRKPVKVLLCRGLTLWRAEPDVRRRALALGCRPVSLRQALRVITELQRGGSVRD